MPLRWVVSIVHVSYDQENFPPIKAQGETKVVTPKFQNTLNFSTYQQTNMLHQNSNLYKSNALIPGRQF